MISEKALRRELKRYPGWIRQALKDKDYTALLEFHNQAETIQWILEANDE